VLLEISSGSARFEFIFREPVRVRFGSSVFEKNRFEFGSDRFEPNRTELVRLSSVRFRSLIHTSFHREHWDSKKPKRLWAENPPLKSEGRFSVFLSHTAPYILKIFSTMSSHALPTNLRILDCLTALFLSYRIIAYHSKT
jgi:hypothetical protein